MALIAFLVPTALICSHEFRVGPEQALTARMQNSGRLDGDFGKFRLVPHGHVATVLGTLRSIGLDRLFDPRPSPMRDRVLFAELG